MVLRTLDIGGDKQLKHLNLPVEANPFLGLRGIRFCFDQEQIFRTQLRAVLRASAFGNLCIMAPMIGSLEDIRRFKAMIQDEGIALDQNNIPWNHSIKIGVMIEIPAVAMIADLIAAEVDFVSIGTNDLCQYLCAADRMNPLVKPYYQDYHPGMFRLIGYVAQKFWEAGKSVGVCGELGGDPLAIPALLGLGVCSFSMGIASIAGVKQTIRHISMAEAQTVAQNILALGLEKEIKETLIAFRAKMGVDMDV